MHFNNVNYRNEFERLQVELLKAEIEHKKEKAEEQRIANVASRRLHGVSEKIVAAPLPPLGSFGSATGLQPGNPMGMTNNHNSLY